ncbi:MAG: MerR family transcriptional regulator [Deltaproteobacteria bacterium]|nr:MerR family transcriptional regulator [Deltaproteobacteria bacterium]
MFTIKQVSEMTDTPPHTLRFWEKEFEGILTPMRTKGGQRRYGSEEISVIGRIKELKDQGISLDRIKRSLSSEGAGVGSSVSHVLEDLVDRLTEIIRTEIYESFRKLNGRPSEHIDRVPATADAERETDAGADSEASTPMPKADG